VSNHLAVATVSAALKRTLELALPSTLQQQAVSVVTGRPEAPSAGATDPKVTVFLYQVTPNPAWRNADLPTRRSDGLTMVQRPQAAVDLHYLISFFGDEKQQVPELLLGLVLRTLHSRPILARDRIQEVSAGPLAGSNLADQVEPVRFVPLAMTLEELSKLWAVFFQIPYRLSLAYQASVVLVEDEIPVPPVKPVATRNIEVETLP
jgi:Pvc16 N-terminal domain